jgi:tRNA (mo5U34)-methyltransferase
MNRDEVQTKVDSVPHWYHRIEVARGVVTPGVTNSDVYLPFLSIPEDCSGKRVLDLGTRDGYFAFEYERRGAEVVAIDYMPREATGFGVAAELLGSRVEYLQANIYDVRPERFGTFDIVLFLGLLYHLPDPLGALELVRAISRDMMFLETQLLDNALLMANGSFARLSDIAPKLDGIPLMQFYPGKALNDDWTNYWAPNLPCIVGMLNECRFRVGAHKVYGSRAIFRCTAVEDANLEHHMAIARGRKQPGG